MYCNITRSQALPLALIRVSSHPRFSKPFLTLKPQYFPIGSRPKPSKNPIMMDITSPLSGIGNYNRNSFCFVKHVKFSTLLHPRSSEIGNRAKPFSVLSGFRVKNAHVVRVRSFSSSNSWKVAEGSGGVRAGNSLPWLAAQKAKEVNKFKKSASAGTSWQESAKRLDKAAVLESRPSSKESEERIGKAEHTKTTRTFQSTWDGSQKKVYGENGTSTTESIETRDRLVETLDNRVNGFEERGDTAEEEGVEPVDDPRWDRIRNRFQGNDNVKRRYEKPEIQRWNKQESWGKKTWKEATESSVPKMVGEGIYGVGPVLAALSAGRREFYVLYVQEGLDLSGTNRKKKDKRGFEKVLRIAEKIGLSTKEISKHDLNMVVDNRPHQGLVLDASPLEMVPIKELDPVSTEGEKGPLWVALDEVTDPQNLGAIIRSAYFFGVSGVVLCAKNSAPLSGVVSKASAGSLELVELRSCKNMMQFLASSAENGWRVLGGSVSSGSVPLNEVLPGAPTILVLGSEGTGLRPLVERSCTQLIKIPGNILVDASAGGVEEVESVEMDRGCSGEEFRSFMAVESLNVSVAAGVLLHHLTGTYNNSSQFGEEQTNTKSIT